MNVVYVADVLLKADTDTVTVTVKETSATRESPLTLGQQERLYEDEASPKRGSGCNNTNTSGSNFF